MTGEEDGPTSAVVAYPMVQEDEATGVVAHVYADLLARRPFVPSLFKSLALCPAHLVLAHEQAQDVLDDDRFTASAQDLVASVRGASRPPQSGALREALARFAAPVSQMTLLSCGLLLALRGDLDAPPAPGLALDQRPTDRHGLADGAAPATLQDAPAPELYGEIRAALRTPIINTVWRQLAAAGQLEEAWRVLGPQVPATRAAAQDLQRQAWAAARQLPWRVAASQPALARVGAVDAAPGAAAVLRAYVATLPRVLVLVAPSAAEEDVDR